MTLVSIINPSGFPVMLGDLLQTSKAAPNQSALRHLPTSGEISARINSEADFNITGLTQKLALVSGKLAFGWAGSKIQARSFYRTLAEEIGERECEKEEVAEIFSKYLSDYNDLAVVGMCLKGERVGQFVINGHRDKTQIGDVRSAGTGRQHLIEIINALAQTGAEGLNPQAASLGLVMSLQGISLMGEVGEQSTYKYFYGGGFETIFALPEDGKLSLIKYDDYCVFFWVINANDSEKTSLSMYPLVLKPFYVGDALCVARLTLPELRVNSSFPNEPNTLNFIEPLYRSIDKEMFKGLGLPSLESRFYINCVTAFKDGTARQFAIVNFNNKEIDFSSNGGKNHLAFRESYLKDLVQRCVQRL